MHNAEITIRQLDENRFILEGRWPDTKALATVEFEVPPSLVTLETLFKIAEQTRETGDSELSKELSKLKIKKKKEKEK